MGRRNVGVDENGGLRWYRYVGHGEKHRTGNPGRDPNSGNSIDNGWQSFRQIFGCGDGVILAIRQNGDLLWYQYQGNGESDPSGNTGWHPNSSLLLFDVPRAALPSGKGARAPSALLGGVYSSTATTVVLAKRQKEAVTRRPELSAGIIAATAVMYPRLARGDRVFQPANGGGAAWLELSLYRLSRDLLVGMEDPEADLLSRRSWERAISTPLC
jgi:hypothetical protein